MPLEDWTPEVQKALDPIGQRQAHPIDIEARLAEIMRMPCPAPVLLGHKDPCHCQEEPEFREVHVWGRP